MANASEKTGQARSRLRMLARSVLSATGLKFERQRFRGVYATYDEALRAVRAGVLAGYDHGANVDVSIEHLSRVALRDYPVLYWLSRIAPAIDCLLDAGGHVGTKYRAYFSFIPDIERINWVVYDLPAMVKAGRERAAAEEITGLTFVERVSDAPPADAILASGLLQYLDVQFVDFMRSLPQLPPHLILNKVATREGPTIVTLENLGPSETPYCIRNRDEFENSLASLGYVIVDQWVIPEFAHVIASHRSLGASSSRGYYARLGGIP